MLRRRQPRLMMEVRFWGVRGSVPWAAADCMGHGCNTPCVEISDEQNGARLILDAGSGIVGLSSALGAEPKAVPILLTHYHWDHLQGLPFFAPLFHAGWVPEIWAPELEHGRPGQVARIFESPFFSVPYNHLPSLPTITPVGRATRAIGGFEVSMQPLHHPGGAFAYRIGGRSGEVVYATDHEFGNLEVDEALAAFALNADAIILDAHFTPQELPEHKGWGHATWQQAADFASACGAGHLWLFHHKPGRTDEEMTVIEHETRRVFPAASAAREGDRFAC
jgi:phosphoribosyl 1,2-cyclic phosphodiesterase